LSLTHLRSSVTGKELPSDQQLALVMKGGSVKGLAYVGALKELEKYYSFNWYIGTSAGAIAAVLLAAGYTTSELEKILSGKDFRDFRDARFYKWPSNLVIHKGIFPADSFTDWIDRLLAEKLNSPSRVRLCDLPHRVTVYASRRDEDTLVFDSHDLERKNTYAAFAVRCSMAIPFFFMPQRDQGIRVLDGGMRNNYPVSALLSEHPGAKFLGLYLGPRTYEGSARTERQGLLIGDLLSIWRESSDWKTLREYRDQTVIIDPRPIRTLDFKLTGDEKAFLIKAGRAAALGFLAEHALPDGSSTGITKAEAQEAQKEVEHERLLLQRKRDAKRNKRIVSGITLFLLLAVGIFFLTGRFPIRRWLNSLTPVKPISTIPEKQIAKLDVVPLAPLETQSIVNEIALSGDGEIAASAEENGVVHIWRVRSGDRPKELEKSGKPLATRCVAIGPNGNTIAAGSTDGKIRLWQSSSNPTPKIIESHTGTVYEVYFSPDGQRLASAGADKENVKSIRLWSLTNGIDLLKTFRTPDLDDQILTVSADLQFVAIFSFRHKRIEIWSLSDSRRASVLENSNFVIEGGGAFSPDGKLFAAGSNWGVVRLWQMMDGKQVKDLTGPDDSVICIAFHPSGRMIASGYPDGSISVWDVNNDEPPRTLKEHSQPVLSVTFSGNGNVFASVGKDGRIHLWEIVGKF
jgi:WD40 repeat protein/predicted acylesterase/phospholipase RssA